MAIITPKGIRDKYASNYKKEVQTRLKELSDWLEMKISLEFNLESSAFNPQSPMNCVFRYPMNWNDSVIPDVSNAIVDKFKKSGWFVGITHGKHGLLSVLYITVRDLDYAIVTD